MFLSTIKQFFKNNKKIFFYIGFFAILFFIAGDSVFAADASVSSGIGKEDVTKWIGFFHGLIKGVSVFLAILTFLATMFLDPAWYNGSLFDLNTYFRSIWILVSNVVYLVFAFLLIWIAFMNIIGKEGETYQLKQALPKFIIGVLLVPFSWFIVHFILSLSAILTVSALSLPYDTFSVYKNNLTDIKIPQKCYIDMRTLAEEGIKCDDSDESVASTMESTNVNNSIFGLISLYTYGITNFEGLSTLTLDDIKKNVNTIGDLIIKVVFDFLFVLIYAILMIALGLVLAIRGIYLWIYIMMSPLFGLMYFFNKNDSGGEGFFAHFNLKEFISLALVPVYTMLALSFGLLFMFVIGQGMMTPVDGTHETSSVRLTNTGIEIGDFTLEVVGGIGSSANRKSVNGVLLGAGQVKDEGLGFIGTFIIQLFGIVVLWGTIMAAMKSSKITEQIVKPIADFGNQVGSLVAKSPQYAPIFGGQSMSSLNQVGNSIQGKISSRTTERANKFLDKTPFGNDSVTKAAQDLSAEIKAIRSDDTSAISVAAKRILKTADGDANKLYGNSELRKALFDLLNKAGIEHGYKSADDISSLDEVAKSYKLLEDKGGLAKDILDVDGSSITANAIMEGVKKYKQATINNSSDTGSSTTSKPVVENTNGKPSMITIGELKVKLEENGSISNLASKENFVEYIEGKTTEEVTKALKKQALSSEYIDNLLKEVNSYVEIDKDKYKKIL